MRQSVPSLVAKIIRYRPHIICFVGKGMWLIVGAALKKQIRAGTPLPGTFKVQDDPLTPPSTPSKSSPRDKAKGKGKGKGNKAFAWGLQPYKLVYPSPHGELKCLSTMPALTRVEAAVKKEEKTMNEGSSVNLSAALTTGMAVSACETLFFVMPSTVGVILFLLFRIH
jgi:hypothetical protein